MIRPISPGATPSNDLSEATEAVPVPRAAQAEPLATEIAAASADPLAKLNALFGAPPPMQSFQADKNGTGGGTQTKHRSRAPAKADPLAGAALPGQKGVVVQRSLGDAGGYETKNHALAWARAAGSERAMVVFGKDKRWHAVETNVLAHDASGGTGPIKAALQVGKVDPAQYDRLKAAAMKDNDVAKWRTFAAYALGLPESEIEVLRKGETPSTTKVNINLSPDFDAEGRTAGFDPKKPVWVQLGPAAFDRPANAAATLAHEEVHADHHRLTARHYATYEHSAHGKDSFRMWAAKHLDTRQADIVAGYEDGALAATELEAHVEAARVAFSSGDLTQARTDLLKVANRPVLPLPQTQSVSIDTLKALRDSLPTGARAVFNEVAQKATGGSVMKGL